MMCKKIVLFSMVLVVVIASNASALTYWTGGTSTDWTDPLNWCFGGGPVPTSTEWTDVLSLADWNWTGNMPVITTGQTAVTQELRLNAGWGNGNLTPTVTVDGGSLLLNGQMYIGENGGGATFTLNSGLVSVGLVSNSWTVVGDSMGTAAAPNDGLGRLYINGGIFEAGTLGIPTWMGHDTPSASKGGHVYIAGGELTTNGIIFTDGVVGDIEFSKLLADGGGFITDTQTLIDADFADWQTTLSGWVGSRLITTDGMFQIDYSSVGEERTATIYTVVPEPMTIILLGFGGLLLRRRSNK
jgi:hypothetical protein